MKNALAFLGSLALTASAASAADRALIIGINDYSAIAPELALTSAVSDAEAWYDILTGPMAFPSDAVALLTDAGATSDAILSTLIDRLVRETTSDDRVVFVFAGRGTRLADGSPALVAHDGNAVLGQIPLGTIAEILDVVSDREISVILDTSFDQGPAGTRGMGTSDGPAASLGEGITLWSASAVGQMAWDVPGATFSEVAASVALNSSNARNADTSGDSTINQAEFLAFTEQALSTWCNAHAPCAEIGWTPDFTGPPEAPFVTLTAAPPREEITTPIVADDGAPASFRETLGFVTDLFAPSNAAELNLEINGGGTLKVGDYVTFTATSERPGTLVLLDVDPMGRLAQVYPSGLSPIDGTKMGPGHALVIPSAIGSNGRPLRIRVTEPAGQGLLLGLFIEDDLTRLAGALPAGIAGGPVANAGQSLFEISQALLRLEADPDRPVSWSATYLPYRIEP